MQTVLKNEPTAGLLSKEIFLLDNGTRNRRMIRLSYINFSINSPKKSTIPSFNLLLTQ